MTGNVLIKNRTPSSDVPYLFGLPKQKTTLLRRTSVLRSKTLAEGEFTSPEHFNFLPESKKEVTTYVVTSFLERATRLARGVITPRHAQRAPSAPPGRFLASLMPCSPLCPLHFQKIKARLTSCLYFLERATRLELATSTLARWRSTR